MHLKIEEKNKPLFCFTIATLITLCLSLFGFLLIRIWPFEDYTLLIIDSIHQYLPFYTDLARKLQSGGSLLYSFSGGFGYNLWTTIAYYMSNPLNLILGFIPPENVCDFMDWFIFIKIGLCAGCFSLYLNKKRKGKVLLPILFGIAYGVNYYIIGYYFNIMWLDSVAMLPLIMLGIEYIVSKKDWRLYCITLFFGIWCNYYIGFMLCIFAVLYFIAQEFINWKNIKKMFLDGIYFAVSSLIAGGGCAVLILPTYMSLRQSESMNENVFPNVVKFYMSLEEMLKASLIGNTPINIADTQAGLNVYCGLLVLFCLILFLFNKNKSIKEKISYVVLTGILLFSFSFNQLNYIWHGFHQQNGLPNRFSFIYVALLLIMAYEALCDIKDYKIWQIVLSFVIPFALMAIEIFYGTLEITKEAYVLFFVLGAAYLIVLIIARITKKQAAMYALCIVYILELTGSTIYGYKINDSVQRSPYVNDLIDYSKLAEQHIDDTVFSRSEIDRQRMRNVSIYAGCNSVVIFNSTMQHSVTDFCKAIGMEARTNKNGLFGITKLMSDFFGIKYIASPARKSQSFYKFNMIGGYGNLDLYKNNNALPIGMVLNEEIKDWDINKGNPFDVQNQFIELATGHDGIYQEEYEVYLEDGETHYMELYDGLQMYALTDKNVKELSVKTPEYDKNVNSYNNFIFPINATEDNHSAEIKATLKNEQDNVLLKVYSCRDSEYQEVVDILKRNIIQNETVGSNKIKGDIASDKNGVFVLTIPYEKGWNIKLDGKKVEGYPVGEMLMGIDITEGHHTIEMVFIPQGFYIGLFISILSAAGFVIMMIIYNKKRKQEKQKTENA